MCVRAYVRRFQIACIARIYSLPLTLALSTSCKVSATFREPSQRLLSAFYFNMHASGAGRARGAAMRRKCKSDPACFARFPGVAGCQTKMLLGHKCAADIELTREHVEQAKRVLREKLGHVALTSCYDASVCNFHKLYGGVAYEQEFSKSVHTDADKRPTHKIGGKGGRWYNESALGGFVDWADEEIFAEAQLLFVEQTAAIVRSMRIESA